MSSDGRPAWFALIGRAVSRLPVVDIACLASLVVACFGGVLFGGKQFAFRDSAHFYYPLYQRVQEQWSSGRLPLWEPGANGGMPLLGMPMAAVLYPGKLVFALLPYAWGVRVYTIGHVVLAFWTMRALAKSWGISRTGAMISGMSYAFGGPILSGYFNIIYLVGSAWMPLGFLAADEWLRSARRSSLSKLAVVLALQILGGDPQSAYLTLVCAFGYAFGLERSAARSRICPLSLYMGLIGLAVAWAWAGPGIARFVHVQGGMGSQALLASAWVVLIVVYTTRRRTVPGSRLVRSLAGLGAAGLLALTMTALQVLPVVEDLGSSVRGSPGGPEDLYDSSVLPYRLLEWVWPGFFGRFTAGNEYWETLLPPLWAHRPSPLSLYSGALPLLLALGACGFRGGPPWRGWMTGVALFGLWGAVGAFAGLASWRAGGPAPGLGDDSFYGLLTTVVPGLRLFRFPFKMLALASLGLSALAGAGWDRVGQKVSRRRSLALAVGGILLMATLAGQWAVSWARGELAAMLSARVADHAVYGPFDARGAVRAMAGAMTHGSIALVASLVVLWGAAGRWRGRAGWVALALVAADLAAADAPLVISAPQADFERQSEAVRAIEAAEKRDPTPGPFRIHRTSSWVPIGWTTTPSAGRLRELVDWEIDTLQPGFGWLHGLSYVYWDEGQIGRRELQRLLRPELRHVGDVLAAEMGIEPGRRIVHHARGVLDLWGARYFIIPYYSGDWTGEHRGTAGFIEGTDLIYPSPDSVLGPEHFEERRRWLLGRDYLVRRNRSAFPRCWVVRDLRLVPPGDGDAAATRDSLITRIRSAGSTDGFQGPASEVDLRKTAFVETDDPSWRARLLQLNASESAEPSDKVDRLEVVDESPERVVIAAMLTRPGVVILADTYHEGWHLAIDGRPARLLRANLLMRAAFVDAGRHTVVFTFSPRSVSIGKWITLAGLVGLCGLVVWSRRRERPAAVA